jgi:1-acyl-sn-glycerol-3-phosphate acyltransferase
MIKDKLTYMFYRLTRFTVVTITRVLCLAKIYGKENIPKTGPVIILCNHQSFLDPMLCQRGSSRDFWYVARSSLYTSPIIGRAMGHLNTIPIHRGESDIASIRKIIGKLKAGCAVGLFPEGTRSLDGKIESVKPGFTLLIRKTKACVVPAVLDGTFDSWPKGQKWPKLFCKSAIRFAEPITAETILEQGDEKFAQLITEQMRKMQNELRTGLGKEPFDYSGEEVENNEGTGS